MICRPYSRLLWPGRDRKAGDPMARAYTHLLDCRRALCVVNILESSVFSVLPSFLLVKNVYDPAHELAPIL